MSMDLVHANDARRRGVLLAIHEIAKQFVFALGRIVPLERRDDVARGNFVKILDAISQPGKRQLFRSQAVVAIGKGTPDATKQTDLLP